MISVIIPHYPIDKELESLLKRCVNSLVGYDELIIVVNDGSGFAKAVNTGMRVARGDYLCVVNNDVYVDNGASLIELTNPEAVMSPIVNRVGQEFWGCFFCLPRWVYEKVGEFDESYELGYYEDFDYIERCKSIGVRFSHNPFVSVSGETASTIKKILNSDEKIIRNLERFILKYGKKPEVDPSLSIYYPRDTDA